MTVNEKIALLRKAMLEKGLDAYIIPSNDPHQSEYVAPHWKSREWISGFTGSAGLVIVTNTKAGLWTDSRYYIQAEKELEGTDFKMYPIGSPSQAAYWDWLVDEIGPGQVLGIDPKLFSNTQFWRLQRILKTNKASLNTEYDLMSEIWMDRPSLPVDPIFDFSIRYNGESRGAKLGRVRQRMKEMGTNTYLLNQLDDIAWLTNLRGKDVSFNPVFVAYFLIEAEKATLFIDPEKVPSELKEALAEDHIQIAPYESIEMVLESIGQDRKVMIEGNLNLHLYQKIEKENRLPGVGLVERMKSIKNSTEVDHLREVMKKDGVALLRLYRWLESVLPSGIISEYDIACQIAKFRSEQPLYVGESFSAIVGFKGNGAIVHYRPTEGDSALLEGDGVLLIDSGGQYQDGTTDITRTIAIGTPSQEQKEAYTQVLQGHIALASIHFPKGTNGGQLDVLARAALWKGGRNYGHGTGHGVGYFLNVHEGPHGISTNTTSPRGKTAIQPGMLTSNEPGFYKSDEYGIRTENLILCVESEYATGGDFLKFETLTLFPIDQSLLEVSLLNEAEKDWLNNYHSQVYEGLAPFLEEEEQKWLASKCVAIQ